MSINEVDSNVLEEFVSGTALPEIPENDISDNQDTDNKEQNTIGEKLEIPEEIEQVLNPEKTPDEVVDKNVNKSPDNSSNQNVSDIDYTEIIKWKVENGEFPEDFEIPEDFENTRENYDKLLMSVKNNEAQAIVNDAYAPIRDINERTGGLIDYLLNGGKLENFNKGTDYSTFSPDMVTSYNAEQIVRNELKASGTPDDAIEDLVERYRDTETLVDKAKQFLPKAKERRQQLITQQQQLAEQAEKAEQERIANFYNNYVEQVQQMNDFLGVKINDTFKNKMINGVTQTYQKINANFNKYLPILTALDNSGILDGDTKFLDRAYKSKAVNKIKNQITPNPFGGKSKIAKMSSFDIEDTNAMVKAALDKR
jgi:hypothetical protein